MLLFRRYAPGLSVLLLAALVSSCVATRPSSEKSPAPAVERPGWSLISSGSYRALAVADMDGDGTEDLVAGSASPGGLAVCYREGPGGGWSSPVFLPVKGAVASVAVADFDGDGRLDVAFSIGKETQGVRVWLNRGGRTWVEAASPEISGTFHGVAAADVNEDGNADLAAAASGTDGISGVRVWLGNGRGGWMGESGPTSSGQYNDVALWDLNGDGHLDLLGSGYGVQGALRVWLGNGRGGWSTGLEVEKGNFYRAAREDVNGDGVSEVVVGTYQRGIAVYAPRPDGGLSRIPGPVEEGSFWQPRRGSDPRGREILASSLDSRGIPVWKGQGNKYVRAEEVLALTGSYYDLVSADLNGDGLKDFAAAGEGEGIRVWLSPGGGLRSRPPGGLVSSIPEPPRAPGEAARAAVGDNEVFKTVHGQEFYRVGPGDVLEITSWKGTEQRIYPVTIGGDGKISFSFVQNISVNGMTLDEVSTLLRREMGKYLREPALDVRVKEYHSKTVTILGAIGSNPYRVSGPGVYPLKGKTTLLMAISDAGGPAANANLQQVSIRKKGGATVTVNLYRTIARGDLTQNVVLDAGDTVLVPELGMAENKVYVLGEVKNPGAFSVKGEITLVEAIALAGSATEPAVLEDTKILRGDLTRPQVLSSDVRRLMKKGDMSQNVKVLPGDIIFVPRSRLGDVTAFLREILPILQTIALPVQFYDYTR